MATQIISLQGQRSYWVSEQLGTYMESLINRENIVKIKPFKTSEWNMY